MHGGVEKIRELLGVHFGGSDFNGLSTQISFVASAVR
jgi:hypothetical protein